MPTQVRGLGILPPVVSDLLQGCTRDSWVYRANPRILRQAGEVKQRCKLVTQDGDETCVDEIRTKVGDVSWRGKMQM